MEKLLFRVFLSVCLLAPFSVDIFISGLPAMQAQFPGSNVTLVLNIILLGVGLSQPIYGPLLDRFGRKPILLGGLYLYTFASFLVATTDSFTFLILGRFFQAIGGSGGVVTSFAIARDKYEGNDFIKAVVWIMTILAIGPITAPLVGSFLNSYWSWRASFVFLFLLGVMYTLFIQFFFKETLSNNHLMKLSFKNITHSYLELAKIKHFLPYCLSSACSYSVLFAYLSLSPVFIMQQMGYSMINYGWIVSINSLAIIIMTHVVSYLALKISLTKIVTLGFSILLLGGVLMFFINTVSHTTLYSFMVPMFIATIGAGIIRPSISTSVMQLAPKTQAGSASAFFNFVSFICAFIVSFLAVKTINTIHFFGLYILLLATVALLLVKIKTPVLGFNFGKREKS